MITSTANDRIKHIRGLQANRRARQKAHQFVIEGPHLLAEAVAAAAAIAEVLYTEAFVSSPEGAALLEDLLRHPSSPALLTVSPEVMRDISDTETPQGVLAVLPELALEPPEEYTFALIIDAISDPGNMGTLMRTAAAAGAPLMYVTAGTVDLYNPKTLRSGAGAHFRLPTRQLSWEGIAARLEGFAIFLADTGANAAAYDEIDWEQPCALIVSDEAGGPSPEARRTAHTHVTIPMARGVDSLNVAAASAIILFEMARQRRT